MWENAGSHGSAKAEQESQMRLFGQIMKFFGGIFGSGDKQPLMITSTAQQPETITLRVVVPGQELKFLFPTHTNISIGRVSLIQDN